MIDNQLLTKFDGLTFADIEASCKTCTACELHKGRTQSVFGSGSTKSKIMIIGEGPGQEEDEQGLPFVGRSGKLLTKILEAVGIDREKDVYIANTVKCRPPNNRTPSKEEIETCKDYLVSQMLHIQPRILILLGTPAIQTVLNTKTPITQLRGKWVKKPVAYMEDLLYIMPMFHPAYLLRNPSKEVGAPKWLTWQDIQEVKTALNYFEMI